MPLLARFAAFAVAAAAASLPIASPLSIDAPVPVQGPHPWAKDGGTSLLVRKDRAPDAPGDAQAGPEPTSLTTLATLVNLHTDELLPLSEVEPTPARFSEFLEDRGLRSRVDINPGLIGLLRDLVRARPGVRIEIVSGYRSPKRNEMMRKKGRNVASHSQHTLGMAIDFRIEGLGVRELAEAIEDLDWNGGLGRYEGAHDRFVHVDLGPRRRWRGK